MNYNYSAYGISINHPQEWRIYVNPNRPFSAHDGSIKIEDMRAELSSQVSFCIKWERDDSVQPDFAQRYLEQIEAQYKRNFKKENQYCMFEKEFITLNGHDACFIHSALNANTHVFKAIGRTIRLEILQCALFCDESKRIVVGTITASSDYIQKNFNDLKKMLFTLHCHSGPA